MPGLQAASKVHGLNPRIALVRLRYENYPYPNDNKRARAVDNRYFLPALCMAGGRLGSCRFP